MNKYGLFWALLVFALSTGLAFGGKVYETNDMYFTGNAYSTKTPTAPTQLVNLAYSDNSSTKTNLYWSWWMLDPAPVTTSVNGSNVWIIGQYQYDIYVTNRSGGATSGTGTYDIVQWNPSNSVDFAGTILTNFTTTLYGTNAAIVGTLTLTAGNLYGIRLTNAPGLAGWHVQFLGNTK